MPPLACPDELPPEVTSEATGEVRAAYRLLQAAGSDASEKADGLRRDALAQARALPEGNVWRGYLEGWALATLGRPGEAQEAFERSSSVCPEIASEIDEARSAAWSVAFTRGLERHRAGDLPAAIAQWELANELHLRLPDASFNLGVVAASQGDFTGALAQYADAWKRAEGLLQEEDREAQALEELRVNLVAGALAAGAKLFQGGRAEEARKAFGRVRTWAPRHRDAAYDEMLALYALQRWDELVAVGTQVVALDPLNKNARVTLYNGLKGQYEEALKKKASASDADQRRARALAALDAADQLPVQLDGMQLAAAEGRAQITARLGAGTLPAGATQGIVFTVVGLDGQEASQEVTLTAPSPGTQEPLAFEVAAPFRPVSWHYQLTP